MEDNVAIKVTGLGKKYTIGKEKDSSLRSSLAGVFKSAASKGNDFWALKDVNFEIKKGEVVGIIGKNGAGKSTLLKVLSQITKPTEGRIEINGRVASLLEVGTGFHPELTGRENIFLNGTILGMTRKEVKEKFDEIIEFSGVQKFVDTPVKHYSSGMYVRLAFAVAAFLNSDILIVDEVLAVGDAEFQNKCMGKMKDSANSGKTVLFVSHNTKAISQFCPKSIFIKQGELIKFGDTDEILSNYLNNGNVISYQSNWSTSPPIYTDDIVSLFKSYIINEKHEQINNLTVDSKFGIVIEYNINKEGFKPTPNIHLITEDDTRALVNLPQYETNSDFSIGKRRAIVWIPSHLLNERIYKIAIGISSVNLNLTHVHDYNAFSIEVTDKLINHSTKNEFVGKLNAIIKPKLIWEIKKTVN